MHLLLLRNSVVAVVLLQGASLAEPPTLPVDATSFAVYRAILDVNTTKPVLLQRETTMWPPPFNGCGASFLAGLSGEWQEAARDRTNLPGSPLYRDFVSHPQAEHQFRAIADDGQ